MLIQKTLTSLLLRTALGAGLVIVPASVTSFSAAMAQDATTDTSTETETEATETDFSDRAALSLVLFGKSVV